MARAHLRTVLVDKGGNVLSNAALWLFAPGTAVVGETPTGTAITGLMYNDRVAGTALSNPLISNNAGEVEAWLETPQTMDGVITDNTDNVYYPGGGRSINFPPFLEVMHAYHDPADVTLGGGGGVTDHGALTGLADDDHPHYETSAEAQAKVDAHTGDTSDAHDASAISILDSASDFTATDVEGALAELQSDNEAHLADAADAHDASAISFTPTGTVAATDVQGAIAEVASEGGGGGGAPTDAPYIVTTPHAGLSAEVAFGTDSPTHTGGIVRGIAANKPASSAFTGQLFIETDSDRIIWRGISAGGWAEVARGEAGIRLAQLAEKDHGSLTGLSDDDHPQYETSAEAQAKVDTHVNDTSDAHDASAVSFVPTGTVASTDVQAAIAEVASEAGAGHSQQHTHANAGDGTTLYPENLAVSGGPFSLEGDLTPAQITANQDNYSPAGLSDAVVLRLSSDASRNITGLAGGQDGRILVLMNVGANVINLLSESASSSAANRFAINGTSQISGSEGVVLAYDSTSSRWRIVGHAEDAVGHNETHDHSGVEGTSLQPVTLVLSGTFYLTGDLTPPQITSDQNNYSPTNLAANAMLRLSSDASRNITGLASGFDGRILLVANVGSQDIVLVDESASSVAANRFAFDGNLTLTPDTGAHLIYDSTSSRWRLLGVGKTTGAGGVTDHGALTGLADDDHPQYETSAEAQAKVDTHVNDTTDAHDASAISILDTAADFTATDVEGALAELQSDNEAHAATVAAPHGWTGTIYFGPPFGVAGGAQWTNQPAGEAFWNSAALMSWRGALDDSTEFRWAGNIWNAGAAGSELILSYSTDGSTWNDIDAELLTAHSFNTAWAALPAGVKVDPVQIAIRGRGGNGTADPAVEHISVMFR